LSLILSPSFDLSPGFLITTKSTLLHIAEFSLFLFFIYLLAVLGSELRASMLTRQALYCLSQDSVPFCSGYLFIYLFILMMLAFELRAACLLGRYYTT
jgi:hypothetical protein